MKYPTVIMFITLFCSIAGCSTMRKTSPDSLRGIPVVEFGNQVPELKDFILYFPAGKPIPVVTSIKGSALAQEAENTQTVALKKSLYAYKKWVSFDGQNWVLGEDVLSINADIKIPSVEHPRPGLLKLQVDLK